MATTAKPPRLLSLPPSRRALKRYAGLVQCADCTKRLCLLPRIGVELAWAEETVTTTLPRRTLTIYFCRVCGEARLDAAQPATPPAASSRAAITLSR